jgi:ABC-2 type transport system permease protein
MPMPIVSRRLRLVVVGGLLSYRALFNWATPAMFAGSLLAAPTMQMAFFAVLGRHVGTADDTFYVVGNSVLAASIPCVFGGTMAIANERRYGTLSAVLLTPGPRVALWTGRALPYAANGVIVMLFTLGVGNMVFDLDLPAGTVGALLPVLLLAALSCSAFGLALGAVGLRVRDVFLLANVVSASMLLLSGANVARDSLPPVLRMAGGVLPLTHAVEAARSITVDGVTGAAWPGIAAEAVVGIGYILLAVVLMRYFESASRSKNALDVL